MDSEALRISRDQSARRPEISTPPRKLARNSPAHSMPTGAGTVSCGQLSQHLLASHMHGVSVHGVNVRMLRRIMCSQ